MGKNENLILQKAKELGFDFVGIAKVRFLEEEAKHLENWLKNGYNAKMSYMEEHFDKRLNPALLVDGAKSVIVVLQNYFPEKHLKISNNFKIAKYSYGKDYHFVVKEKLKKLYEFIQKNISQDIYGRCFIDSAPVLDRAWAKLAGLGWIGKNNLLINKNQGSFFVIGELIIDLKLDYNKNISPNYCGNCTLCIDACPTNAIEKPFVVNANKCISYCTMQLKDDLPKDKKNEFKNWIFGCDICQDVCPYNKRSIFHQEENFLSHPDLLSLTKKDWQNLTAQNFSKIFGKTPIKRIKFKTLKRNINFFD